MSYVKESIKGLSPDEQDQLKQYGTSIKEIKKKIMGLIKKGHSNLKEQGGNMSSGLVLHDEE
jgi:hypothetical protein